MSPVTYSPFKPKFLDILEDTQRKSMDTYTSVRKDQEHVIIPKVSLNLTPITPSV
jgi:hypothetical protein